MKNMNRPAPLCGVSCKLTRRPCKTVQSTHPRGVRHLFEHGHQLRQIISTHAPREGCDRSNSSVFSWRASFQSTHPARGATVWVPYHPFILPISIHAPREGCDDRRLHHQAIYGRISIHAPREGCDCFGGDGVTGAVIFQSTHPARGAT